MEFCVVFHFPFVGFVFKLRMTAKKPLLVVLIKEGCHENRVSYSLFNH